MINVVKSMVNVQMENVVVSMVGVVPLRSIVPFLKVVNLNLEHVQMIFQFLLTAVVVLTTVNVQMVIVVVNMVIVVLAKITVLVDVNLHSVNVIPPLLPLQQLPPPPLLLQPLPPLLNHQPLLVLVTNVVRVLVNVPLENVVVSMVGVVKPINIVKFLVVVNPNLEIVITALQKLHKVFLQTVDVVRDTVFVQKVNVVVNMVTVVPAVITVI